MKLNVPRAKICPVFLLINQPCEVISEEIENVKGNTTILGENAYSKKLS